MIGLIRFALLAVLLAGCGRPGASTQYPKEAQNCVKATREWLTKPTNKALLSKALADCDRTLVACKGRTDVEKLRSYRDLEQLKMSLETARAVMDQGGDPQRVESTIGIIPADSVRIVMGMVENDLQDEAGRATPAP